MSIDWGALLRIMDMSTIPTRPEPHIIRHEDKSQFRECRLTSWQRIRHCATLKRPIVPTEDIKPISKNTSTFTTGYATEYCHHRWCIISAWIDPDQVRHEYGYRYLRTCHATIWDDGNTSWYSCG